MSNVKGVKNTQEQLQQLFKLRLKISQRLKWNHQSKLKFKNQFKKKKK
jgi:hypothetical protein